MHHDATQENPKNQTLSNSIAKMIELSIEMSSAWAQTTNRYHMHYTHVYELKHKEFMKAVHHSNITNTAYIYIHGLER